MAPRSLLSRPRLRTACLGVVLVALPLAACGDEGGGDAADTTTTTVDAADGDGTTTTAADEAMEPGTARFMNIRLEDFPSEYAPTPLATGLPEQEDADEIDQRLLTCLGRETDAEQITGHAESARFAVDLEGSRNIVGSSTTVFDDADLAEDLFADLEGQAATCAEAEVDGAFPGLPAGSEPQADDLEVDAGSIEAGDDAIRVSGEVQLTADDDADTARLDVVYVRTGPTITTLVFSGLPDPLPEELITELTGTVADRQAAS